MTGLQSCQPSGSFLESIDEEAMLRPGEAERFLAILGIDPKKPGIDELAELVRAHLLRIPFENISKLFRWRCKGVAGLVPFSEYLYGIEQHHFGGTCYTINFHLHQLLVALGYDVLLCGADMSRPDVHPRSGFATRGGPAMS